MGFYQKCKMDAHARMALEYTLCSVYWFNANNTGIDVVAGGDGVSHRHTDANFASVAVSLGNADSASADADPHVTKHTPSGLPRYRSTVSQRQGAIDSARITFRRAI